MKCPVCKVGTWVVTFYDEYIGEHPQGGYQTFVDEIISDCECEITDEQTDAIIKAEEHAYQVWGYGE